jgi:hypothetical protein
MLTSERMNNDSFRRAAVRCLLLSGMLFCTTGASCTRGIRSPFAAWTPPAPEVLATGSSLDQVIAAVNQNASKINSYQTNNASITIPGMPAIPLLRGNIAAQRPGRIRLQASTALTGPEVDLGSSDELFWFWVKRNEPPAVYFARHDQFCGSAAQKLMPIEPQWLLDAVGFTEFRPGDHHEGPHPLGGGKVEVKSLVNAGCGSMTKRTVLDARTAQVLEQHVYDDAGTLIASAVAKSHRYYPEAGVSLPQEIDIRIPASELSLSIDVGTVAINGLTDSPQLWTLPTFSGSQQVDLGTAPRVSAVAPIGDQLTRADWARPASVTGPASLVIASQPAIPVMQNAPKQTALPLATPLKASMPSPQSLAPGGIAAAAPESFAAQETSASAQRLPSGGVPADSGFVR